MMDLVRTPREDENPRVARSVRRAAALRRECDRRGEHELGDGVRGAVGGQADCYRNSTPPGLPAHRMWTQ